MKDYGEQCNCVYKDSVKRPCASVWGDFGILHSLKRKRWVDGIHREAELVHLGGIGRLLHESSGADLTTSP